MSSQRLSGQPWGAFVAGLGVVALTVTFPWAVGEPYPDGHHDPTPMWVVALRASGGIAIVLGLLGLVIRSRIDRRTARHRGDHPDDLEGGGRR